MGPMDITCQVCCGLGLKECQGAEGRVGHGVCSLTGRRTLRRRQPKLSGVFSAGVLRPCQAAQRSHESRCKSLSLQLCFFFFFFPPDVSDMFQAFWEHQLAGQHSHDRQFHARPAGWTRPNAPPPPSPPCTQYVMCAALGCGIHGICDWGHGLFLGCDFQPTGGTKALGTAPWSWCSARKPDGSVQIVANTRVPADSLQVASRSSSKTCAPN